MIGNYLMWLPVQMVLRGKILSTQMSTTSYYKNIHQKCVPNISFSFKYCMVYISVTLKHILQQHFIYKKMYASWKRNSIAIYCWLILMDYDIKKATPGGYWSQHLMVVKMSERVIVSVRCFSTSSNPNKHSYYGIILR